MDERTGVFRVYRVVEAVPHINLFDTDATRLYTVYQSGYGERQPAVDGLRTGALVEATLGGDPDDSDEAWSLLSFERLDRVAMDFAVDAEVPEVAADLWEPGLERPASAVLEEDGEPVAECFVQSRAPLPGGTFVPSVLTGLVPMESLLTELPGIGEPPTDAIFIDPDPPDADSYARPYGVAVLFTAAADDLLAEFRDRYNLSADADNRPEYDPYGL
ncbi:hypothetical protein HISP_11105 [Haloarcula hispanica N601]|uniref:Uncharacterized protein n=3 Tax=Haloarcula hispanica TaxID=51589 RepID=V5TNH1_HALHI|nr:MULTISPECIES: hypothetical protein [Haloarcula]AEM57768.1 conserved hypothetical protein [Haloarcula hispanica ATCC 33960]AHB66517.1 hypothetical protein HISP_11105 [Haloarcula hispanica N601]KAA9406544.1 hypothetical protein Har1131_06875 [Haloarcula sp. CBA1131]MCJ0619513.1 hypothetical protein [Haloarcula hispanica]RYJ09992.1 hypothetical protein ELS20_08260 [Haloarcula hispanica]